MTPAATPPTLGELNTPAAFDALFLLGDAVAAFNSTGVLLRPGFGADLALDNRLGRWVITGTEHVVLNGFMPEKAASQFADFTGERLRAVVGGYARKSYQLLEPVHLGFTQDLLAQLLPEPVPTVPQPRSQVLDFAGVLGAYGGTLHYAEDRQLRLTFAPPAPPDPRPTDTELLLASIVVFVAQLNLTPWLLHVAACDPKHKVAQILGSLARHEFTEPATGGLIPMLFSSFRAKQQLLARIARQPFGLATLLTLLAGLYDSPENPEESYDKLSIFRVLRNGLEKLGLKAPELREAFLTGIIDGLEYLASSADAQGHTLASLQFAQSAQVTLQLLLERVGPATAEAWFSRTEAVEQRYSWSALSPDDAVEQELVLYFANYVGSAALTVNQYSKVVADWFQQGQVKNQLWTATWRAIALLRQALRLSYALAQQQPPTAKEDSANQVLVLQNLLAHYQQALKNLAAMIGYSSVALGAVSHWASLISAKDDQEDGLLMQEIRQCLATHHTLEEHGYGLETVQSLGTLVALLPY